MCGDLLAVLQENQGLRVYSLSTGVLYRSIDGGNTDFVYPIAVPIFAHGGTALLYTVRGRALLRDLESDRDLPIEFLADGMSTTLLLTSP